MTSAKRDDNRVPVALGVSSTDATAVLPFLINPVNGRVLTDNAGGGSGTVTSVSVVSANGFAGTVATATTTPAITLTTTITGLLKGNGTAISAATSGVDYSSGTSALATGLVKNTTGSGSLSIATAGTDYLAPNSSGASLTGIVEEQINTTFTNGVVTGNTDTATRLGHIASAGVIDGGDITDNGNGTVNLASAVAEVRQNISVTGITRSGTTATATTAVAHNYATGDIVLTNGADQAGYNLKTHIVVTGANTYTYTVDVGTTTPATGTIFSTSEHSKLYTVAVPAVNNLALTDHATNYVYVTYGLGTPAYAVTTDKNQVFGLARVNTWIIAREGNTLWFVDARNINVDSTNKFTYNHINTMSFSHKIGGSVLTGTGTRNIAVTAGSFYYGPIELPHAAFDTSAASSFTTAYQTGGTWTFTSGQTQIDNTQYNNTGTGLATLTTGNYGVHWVYIMNNNPSTLMVVYGTGDYSSKALARNSQEPTLPSSMQGVSQLLGRIIILKSASTFTDVSSAFSEFFPVATFDLGSLSNVTVPDAPNLNDRLIWNGSVWVNGPASSAGAGGAGTSFYNATPSITATGTNNANAILTLSKTPVTTAEQTNVTSLATNTVLAAAWLYDTALGRTTIDAGIWSFDTYAGVNSVAGGRVTTIQRNVMQVIPAGGGTVTTTGAGTSRTATVSGATPFVSGDANADQTIASFLQTPQGLYQITAFTSSTVVTIAVPTTYANETGVTYNKWFKLFGATSAPITAITPAYADAPFTSTQGAFTIATTDKLGIITFGTSNNTTTLTTVYNGTTHNSRVLSPLATLHNELAGLQGGQSNQYYHLTSNEYQGTGVGTGNIARLISPNFTTPLLGTPTSGTLTNCTGLPIAGLVSSTSTALGVGSIELGHATDTTIARVSAGVISVEGVTVDTASNTLTLTNKRINPRLVTAASYTTDTGTSLDVSTCDQFEVTAQAGALKFNNPGGTPVGGQKLIIRIKDNGTARALTYDTQFRASSDLALPTTTVLSKTLYMGFVYNATDTKWDLLAVLNNF